MEDVLLFKQFESDTTLPGPDASERQNIECSAIQLLPGFEPNTCPALPSDVVAKEVASHAERGTFGGSASCQSGYETMRIPKCLSDACS